MRIRPPTPSGIAIGVALVVVLTAGAAAGQALITSADIKDNTIQSVDVKNASLTTDDIKNETIKSGDILNGTINTNDIANGTITLGDINDSSEQQLLAGMDIRVGELTGLWRVSNDTVSMTPDGVEFGLYENGSAEGGTIFFNGLNGMTLADVENLVYYARYTATGGGVGVPFLRIFLETPDGEQHSAIFSPSTQAPDPDIAEGPFHEWVTTSGGWRYDDDGGIGPDMPFSELVAEHGTEVIADILITTGFSSGQDLSALLRWLEVNGQTYAFGG